MTKELIVNATMVFDNPARLRVSTSRLDFGSLEPNQVVTQHLLLENVGGPFAGRILFSLQPETDIFQMDYSATVGLIFPIKITVEVNTSISAMEDLGPHSAVLTIDAGKNRKFEIPLAVHVNPFPAASH